MGIHTYMHTYIHTYMFVADSFSPLNHASGWLTQLALAIYMFLLLISMIWLRQAIFESKGDKLSSSDECRIRTQGLWNRISGRLNTHWQTDWAIEDQVKNSIARPYDHRAFSPLDPPAGWLSHLALAIYMFVLLIRRSGTENRFSIRKETICLQLLNAGSLKLNL